MLHIEQDPMLLCKIWLVQRLASLQLARKHNVNPKELIDWALKNSKAELTAPFSFSESEERLTLRSKPPLRKCKYG